MIHKLLLAVALTLATGCPEVPVLLECFDADGDGVSTCADDCDDNDPLRAPGLAESCDGIDNNCDGSVPPTEVDGDGDGVASCDGDCAPADASRAPGQAELCNGIDDDCDGVLPNEELDLDGDGFRRCDDCDDVLADVNPGADEVCNGRDDDCDGDLSDEELDGDGDGGSVCDGDCDDDDALVGAGLPEFCDGLDNDCDGVIPGEEVDADGDGASVCDGDCDDGDASLNLLDLDADAWTSCAGDCDDTDSFVTPASQEVCDGRDNNCDGVIPADEVDDDGDGDMVCGGDCDDDDPTVESLDVDGDSESTCDGDCDDNDPLTNADADGDGLTSCDGDCDDTDDTVLPGVWEDADDGVDSDCGGNDWTDLDDDIEATWDEPSTPADVVFTEVADLDGDGVAELLFDTPAGPGPSGSAGTSQGWLLQSAEGAFDQGSLDSWATTIFSGSVDVALAPISDLSGDGLPEIAMAEMAGGRDTHIFDGAVVGAGGTLSAADAFAVLDPDFTVWSGISRPVLLPYPDIDGDGTPEVLFHGQSGSFYLVSGAAITPGPAVSIPASAIVTVTGIVVGVPDQVSLADLDGDTLPEIVVTPNGPSGPTEIIDGATLAAATGTQTIANLSTWSFPETRFNSGDFDGDGVTDFLVGGSGGNQIRLGAPLVAAAPGALAPPEVDLGTYAFIMVGDVDGSGADDLISVPTFQPDWMVTVVFDPGLRATVPVAGDVGLWPPSSPIPWVPGVVDLDGDGADDIILNAPVLNGVPGVSVLLSPY